jgi:hypothetical protein
MKKCPAMAKQFASTTIPPQQPAMRKNVLLAWMLPVRRQTLQADKRIEDLITEFFTLRFEPRRIPADTVRLDATEYELEYVGDDTLLFDTDDDDTPLVKWIESLLSAVHDAASR